MNFTKPLKYIKNNIFKILTIAIPTIFLLIILSLTNNAPVQETKKQSLNELDKGWSITYKGKTENLKALPCKIPVKSNQQYKLNNQLPKNLHDGDCIVIRNSKQRITVFVDGQKIYNNENQDIKTETIFLPMKKEYSGKTISLVCSSSISMFSGRIDRIYCGRYMENLFLQLKLTGRLLLFYMFLIICGMILILCFFITKARDFGLSGFLYLGLFTIALSATIIVDNNLLQYYVENQYLYYAIGMLSKLLLPFMLIGFIYSESEAKFFKDFLNNVLLLYVFLNIGMLLNFTHSKLAMERFLILYEKLTIVTFFVLMVMVLIEIVQLENMQLVITFLAMSFLGFSIVVEIVGYYQYVTDYYNMGIFLGAGLLSYLLIKVSALIYILIRKLEEAEKIKQQLNETRIRVMLSQIKPHFIYNTLNTIEALIDIDPDKASDMIISFSKYLRSHIDTIGQENLIPFNDEIKNIKAYTDIECVRFPKINIVFDIKSKDFEVPILSIQPLVENAIKHGVSKKTEGGTVTIKSYDIDEFHIIEVKDNGIGFDLNSIQESTHVGIKNIKFRLNKLINADISYSSNIGIGTEIKILIPKNSNYKNIPINHLEETSYENNFGRR